MDADVYVKELGNDGLPAGAAPALSQPTLIIKLGDTYWVTVAVVGYRLTDAVGQDQIDGSNDIISRFNDNVIADRIAVAVVDDSRGLVLTVSDQSTGLPSHPPRMG